jgi:hypothetical protein
MPLQNSHTFNLNIRIQRQRLNRHTRPARFDVTPISAVDLVHFRKIGHIRQKNIHLHHFANVGARGLENCS